MRLKLAPKPVEKLGEKESTGIQIRRLLHPSEILPYLEKERTYTASAIAHLEPELLDSSKWFLAVDNSGLSLCLISRSTSPSYLLTLGDDSTLDCLLGLQPLPGKVMITCRPQHLDIVKKHYEITWHWLIRRMVTTREKFTPAKEGATYLRPGHIRELNQLYASHMRYYFSTHQIRQGIYYGVWCDEQLVAVAGTIFISQSYGIARVGNVLTHVAYRNQGLATICTSAVTDHLLDFCTEVVLDVEPQNLPAKHVYANLGYRDDCDIVEAVGRRRSFVNVIKSNVCKKIGLSMKKQGRTKLHGEL